MCLKQLTFISSRVERLVTFILRDLNISKLRNFFFFINSSAMCFFAVWMIPIPANLKNYTEVDILINEE
jgi:hypothetical protein